MFAGMDLVLSALLIFGLRVADVSIGTLRTLFTVRGRKYVSATLAFCEASIFILALSHVMKFVNQPLTMFAYAAGFAAGNFSGITIERWIGSGTILVRIIAKNSVLLVGLRDQGFGVTVTRGEGLQGEVAMLFVVAPRRRERELMRLIEQLDPTAFVTLDAVHHALGGYLTSTATTSPSSVRK
jgi:uncharacterized protein YebE (UPF0316 family)